MFDKFVQIPVWLHQLHQRTDGEFLKMRQAATIFRTIVYKSTTTAAPIGTIISCASGHEVPWSVHPQRVVPCDQMVSSLFTRTNPTNRWHTIPHKEPWWRALKLTFSHTGLAWLVKANIRRTAILGHHSRASAGNCSGTSSGCWRSNKDNLEQIVCKRAEYRLWKFIENLQQHFSQYEVGRIPLPFQISSF